MKYSVGSASKQTNYQGCLPWNPNFFIENGAFLYLALPGRTLSFVCGLREERSSGDPRPIGGYSQTQQKFDKGRLPPPNFPPLIFAD